MERRFGFPPSLEGRVAVVTGSSSGVGRATALALAAAGADVLVHARRSREAAEQTAEMVRGLNVQAQVCLADLADPAQREQLIQQAWQWQGRVDIWINNAGADVLTGDDANRSFEEKLDLLWKVDVLGTIDLARKAGRRMRDEAGAERNKVILNTGWDQAEIGMAGDSGEMFAAIKGAIMAFTRSLAKSLAPQVRVNCLAPGWIRTAWGAQASEYWQQRAMSECLLQRWGTPDDVAQVARFLASDDAGFITGQIVPINGGFIG